MQSLVGSCFRFSALGHVRLILLMLVKAQVCLRKDSNVCIAVGSPNFTFL